MDTSKMKRLQVTITQDFIIEMIDEKRTDINGWTIKEIIKDWFKNENYSLDTYHATRDGRKIGGASKFIKAELKYL